GDWSADRLRFLDAGDLLDDRDERAHRVHRAIVPLGDSCADRRLCFGGRGHGYAAPRGSEVHQRGAAGFVLPAGAVVATAMNSALPALQRSAADPAVQAALNRSIYWSSIQGLGNGFLFLVLVVASIICETIDRRFGSASIWCLVAAVFAW